jgi:hypothetical protein
MLWARNGNPSELIPRPNRTKLPTFPGMFFGSTFISFDSSFLPRGGGGGGSLSLCRHVLYTCFYTCFLGNSKGQLQNIIIIFK